MISSIKYLYAVLLLKKIKNKKQEKNLQLFILNMVQNIEWCKWIACTHIHTHPDNHMNKYNCLWIHGVKKAKNKTLNCDCTECYTAVLPWLPKLDPIVYPTLLPITWIYKSILREPTQEFYCSELRDSEPRPCTSLSPQKTPCSICGKLAFWPIFKTWV